MTEHTIQLIAQAVIANTEVLSMLIDALPHEDRAAVADAAVPAPVAPAPVAPAPVAPAPVAPAPVAPAPVAPAPVGEMPAPPTFAPPAQVQPGAAIPFSDAKGLVDYVMKAYTEMGPQKGAGIQNVLVGLGYQNINDIRPEHYEQLYRSVELLKVSP